MHEDKDIRWLQRFSNYRKALQKLKQSVEYVKSHHATGKTVLDEMLKEGVIQRFEYTHELAWNTIKDFAEYQGIQNISGSRDAVREAFRMQLITDGQLWMDMIQSRNKTTHTYNQDTADEIFNRVVEEYYPAFITFEKKMEEKRSGNQTKIL